MTAHGSARPPFGWWVPDGLPPLAGDLALAQALADVGRPLTVVRRGDEVAVVHGGHVALGPDRPAVRDALPVVAVVPALDPRNLGDPEFRATHKVRYAYVSGAMANGIASEDLVEAMAREGFLAFFGAAGLAPARVEAAMDRLQRSLAGLTFGSNLIHSPGEPELEARVAEIYIRRGVRLVSASAYMGLTLPLLRYRTAGIHRDAGGRVVTPNRVVGKVSRVEVARHFLSPPPGKLLQALVEQGHLTPDQAVMAESVPVADDLTAEADSGGHTDNRPAIALLPTMLALRDELQARYRFPRAARVGLAGGISTPESVTAAFAMGASYVLTGSVNQACLEAGTSDSVREMLAKASQADVAMAPAADMFEMGVKLQVLKWGTMFPVKARRLYELYRAYDRLESLPPAEVEVLERDFFRRSLAEEWEHTRSFFQERDPGQVGRAEEDPRHKMALVFRSYLGQSSAWANLGVADRKVDYQVWCGPAMGAFNEWARGSFLEQVSERRAPLVGLNLMLGAAVLTRASWLRAQGVRVPDQAARFRPLRREEIARVLEGEA